jgi:hypothetical protein
MHILPQTEVGLFILKTRNETFFQPLQHILILILAMHDQHRRKTRIVKCLTERKFMLLYLNKHQINLRKKMGDIY